MKRNASPLLKRNTPLKTSLWALVSLTLQGCATIVHGPNQRIEVVSEPAGATVALNYVEVGKTPTHLVVPRYRAGLDIQRGWVWRGGWLERGEGIAPNYQPAVNDEVVVLLDGYETQRVTLAHRFAWSTLIYDFGPGIEECLVSLFSSKNRVATHREAGGIFLALGAISFLWLEPSGGGMYRRTPDRIHVTLLPRPGAPARPPAPPSTEPARPESPNPLQF